MRLWLRANDYLEQREVCIKVGNREHRLLEYGFNVEHEPWPIDENCFDIVIACEIVEHLAMDPMALFAGANRVLKPGGYFFVSTPNAASIQNLLKLGRMMPAGLASQFRRPFTIARLYERHNREYSPFTIGEMMQCAGFEIALMETDSAFPVDNLGYSEEQVAQIIGILGIPELRCDTVNVIGKKIGDVADRFPASHDLYVPSDG
jgi:SAM-dependent methyltransferase